MSTVEMGNPRTEPRTRRTLEARLRRGVELFLVTLSLIVGLGVIGGCGALVAIDAGAYTAAALMPIAGILLVAFVYVSTSISRDARILKQRLLNEQPLSLGHHLRRSPQSATDSVSSPARVKVARRLPHDPFRVVAMTTVLLALGGVGAFLIWPERPSPIELRPLEAVLLERLRASDYAGLVELAQNPDSRWEDIVASDELVAATSAHLFAEVPWLSSDFDPNGILEVIERGHRLWVPSRALFGAMSFALEEVWLRASDPNARARARALAATVRKVFITFHEARTPGFQRPPEQARDPLNAWVVLRAGEFLMGADDVTPREQPPHPVRLSAFSMQRHEVTIAEYRRFDPGSLRAPDSDRHPVTSVTWYDAVGYAAWLGASLPSEAEWEYAARGTGLAPPRGQGGRPYPWGFEPVTHERAVFIDYRSQYDDSGPSASESLQPVGSLGHPGRTPEGLDDMAGNVSELCRDWYAPYGMQPLWDPIGPTSRDAEVIPYVVGGTVIGDVPIGPANRFERARSRRGGSVADAGTGFLAARRDYLSPHSTAGVTGFRLVSSRFDRDAGLPVPRAPSGNSRQ